MKAKVKQILLWSVTVILALALFSFVNQRRKNALCTSVKVEFTGNPELQFVGKEDVLDLLYSKGFRIEQVAVGSINLMEIEKELTRHPAIKSTEAFFTSGNVLNIRVQKREPVLRVIDSSGESYYLDEDGEYMPLQDSYTARVPVASGVIMEKMPGVTMKEIMQSDSLQKVCILDDLYMISSAARRDTFIWAQMEQLNVLPDREIELIPAIGPGKVLLGDASGISDKFNRFSLFYKEGLPKAGWNTYSSINLKFNNQIICTQNTY
ncbi:MAG: hypothetical protein KDC13_03180 [Bacteroidetes bacterium]|nr:hypothetical protein [Bacteroidota bacterium]